VTPAEWSDAVTAASLAGALPELPPPYAPDPAASTHVRFGDVPGVRGIFDVATSREPEWLWSLLTGTVLAFLLLAFGLAVFWQLRAARREVAAARTQTRFLTTVTHELKTPLAGIRLLGEMLAEGRAHGREAEYYRLLVGEAGRLSMLIENVLDLGRLERGERGSAPAPVAVGDVVGETLAMFAPVAERDGLAVTWSGETNGLLVHIDRAAFVQAFVAVLDNARKYGGDGATIDVTCQRDDGGLLLRVRDRGPGVPAGERNAIFDRFVRGSAHRHGSTPGVGIGLYLARTIARCLGGDLVCTPPAHGAGAQFTFTFPLEPAA
jgi:signal transduction histidine kinase